MMKLTKKEYGDKRHIEYRQSRLIIKLYEEKGELIERIETLEFFTHIVICKLYNQKIRFDIYDDYIVYNHLEKDKKIYKDLENDNSQELLLNNIFTDIKNNKKGGIK